MKFSIEDVADSMKQAQVGSDQIDATMKKLAELERQAEEEREKNPRTKKQYVILASGEVSETPMWILQIDEGDDHSEVLSIINKVAKLHNDNPRKKDKVSTVGEAIRDVPKKDFTAFGLSLKTKEAVIVVETDNQLRQEVS